MKRLFVMTMAAIGVWAMNGTAQAQFLQPPRGGNGSYNLLADLFEGMADEQDESDDEDLKELLRYLQQISNEQQRRQPSVQRPVVRNQPVMPASTPAQQRPTQPTPPQSASSQPVRSMPTPPQVQGPSRQDLVQLLEQRKEQASQLERLIPLAQQQAASMRQTTSQMGTAGIILQMQFDNQVRVFQQQYAYVTTEIQAIDARLRGF